MSFGGILRQSTAVDVLIGPFVDSTDGDTEEAALTINRADVLLSKNGQGAVQKTDVTAAASDADGFYNCELDATDTDTVGQLVLYVHVAGALAVRHDFQIVEEEPYDDIFAASAVGYLKPTTAGRDLDVTAAGEAGIDLDNTSGTIAAAQIATDAITAAKIAADAIGASELATGAVNEIVDQVWNEAQADHVAGGSMGLIASEIADILVDSNELQGDTHTAAEVWTSGTRTLSANTNLNDPTAATIADAVHDEARADHTILGSYGDAFIGLVTGSAEAGTLSTTQMTSDLAEATDDHYNGRTVVWTSGVLAGQASDITDYLG
ncbi:hypothetical protein LCGC14_2183150, partial [marine sediment metagenome]